MQGLSLHCVARCVVCRSVYLSLQWRRQDLVRRGGGTILSLNENNSSHKHDTKYLHVATTELQKLLPQTVNCSAR